jgi:hypothetical protein
MKWGHGLCSIYTHDIAYISVERDNSYQVLIIFHLALSLSLSRSRHFYKLARIEK